MYIFKSEIIAIGKLHVLCSLNIRNPVGILYPILTRNHMPEERLTGMIFWTSGFQEDGFEH